MSFESALPRSFLPRRLTVLFSSATFQLTTNYRSHGGICDAADALIKVIRDLFPNSIDHLDPEKGLVQGPKPSFLTQRSESIKEVSRDWLPLLFSLPSPDSIFVLLPHSQIFSSSEGTSEIEFGAHQCILVRSEKTRDDLREKLGKDAGLIMTISESKGSFDDFGFYSFSLLTLPSLLPHLFQVSSSRMWSSTTSSTTRQLRNLSGESSSRTFQPLRLLDSM